jgi:FeS assembly SUF system regulator
MRAMLRLTNLADYAVVVMTAAVRAEGCASAATIARATGLSAATAAKLLNLLARAGLLASTRGAAGGFRLARPAQAISLAEIVEAIDGPIALTHCVAHGHEQCEVGEGCTARGHWPIINQTVRRALASVTLDALARHARPVRLPAPELA